MAQIYDVSVPLREGMPTFDRGPGPVRRLIKELGKDGEPANVSIVSLGIHSGTHVDAPNHFFPGGIGVDDPPAAHLTLLKAGVVILEGLDLRGVPAGEYRLACLPIKLPGSDGAPARAVLSTPP